jgi:hypothetical protein
LLALTVVTCLVLFLLPACRSSWRPW